MVGEKYKIDVVCMDMGNNGPVIRTRCPLGCVAGGGGHECQSGHPDHFDNWANCYEDPSYLVDIVNRKNKENRPEMKAVILLPGARYEHPTDMNMGRYVYPDWREWMNWKKSLEYGPNAKIERFPFREGCGPPRRGSPFFLPPQLLLDLSLHIGYFLFKRC